MAYLFVVVCRKCAHMPAPTMQCAPPPCACACNTIPTPLPELLPRLQSLPSILWDGKYSLKWAENQMGGARMCSAGKFGWGSCARTKGSVCHLWHVCHRGLWEEMFIRCHLPMLRAPSLDRWEMSSKMIDLSLSTSGGNGASGVLRAREGWMEHLTETMCALSLTGDVGSGFHQRGDSLSQHPGRYVRFPFTPTWVDTGCASDLGAAKGRQAGRQTHFGCHEHQERLTGLHLQVPFYASKRHARTERHVLSSLCSSSVRGGLFPNSAVLGLSFQEGQHNTKKGDPCLGPMQYKKR
ncbi:hypothetical protein L345_12375, partial [Ophiophagus hannah]